MALSGKALYLLAPETGETLAKRAQKGSYLGPKIADVRGANVLTTGPLRIMVIE